jgi:hypothetical protein
MSALQALVALAVVAAVLHDSSEPAVAADSGAARAGQHGTMRALGQKPYRECADMGMRTLLRPVPARPRTVENSSPVIWISRSTCVAPRRLLHTDVESLRFLPPRRTITTERGDAVPRSCRGMAAVRPDCHRMWPSVRPRAWFTGPRVDPSGKVRRVQLPTASSRGI